VEANEQPTYCSGPPIPVSDSLAGASPGNLWNVLHWDIQGVQPARNKLKQQPRCEKRLLRCHARIAVRTALPHSPQLQNLLWLLPVLARLQERAQLVVSMAMERTRRPSCGGVRTKYSSSRGLPTHPLGLPFVVVQERRVASQMRGHETMLFVVVLTNLPYLRPQSSQVVVLAWSSSSSSSSE
jgi:hypothetical protein